MPSRLCRRRQLAPGRRCHLFHHPAHVLRTYRQGNNIYWGAAIYWVGVIEAFNMRMPRYFGRIAQLCGAHGEAASCASILRGFNKILLLRNSTRSRAWFLVFLYEREKGMTKERRG